MRGVGILKKGIARTKDINLLFKRITQQYEGWYYLN